MRCPALLLLLALGAEGFLLSPSAPQPLNPSAAQPLSPSAPHTFGSSFTPCSLSPSALSPSALSSSALSHSAPRRSALSHSAPRRSGVKGLKALVDIGQVLIAQTLGTDFEDYYTPGTAILVTESERSSARALILNRPTPLLIKHLDLPRLTPFRNNVLFHGGQYLNSLADSASQSEPNKAKGRVAGGSNLLNSLKEPSAGLPANCMSPQHWVHRVEGIKGSVELDFGLYLGGNINELSSLVTYGFGNPKDFKFFYQDLVFEAGQLQQENDAGIWVTADVEDQYFDFIFSGCLTAAASEDT